MEEAEIKVWEIFNRWDSSIPVPDVHYNREFNLIDFKESMLAISEIMTMELGEKFQKRGMKTTVGLLNNIEKISQEEKDEIIEEIEKQAIGGPVTIGDED